jgi:ABC-type Fe3+-siderophore transport system permease subunit
MGGGGGFLLVTLYVMFMFLNAFIGKIIQKKWFWEIIMLLHSQHNIYRYIIIDIVLIYVSVKFVFTMQLGLVGSSVNVTIRNEVTVPKILKIVDLLIEKNLAAVKLGTLVVKMVRSRSRSCRISQSTIPKVLWETRKIIF